MEDYKKLYEDLVDRIKTMAKAQPLCTKEAIEMHFPEIVESEDERIRKELIAEVKEQIDCIPAPDCRDKEDEKALKRLDKWLTWLEKYKEEDSYAHRKTQEFMEGFKRVQCYEELSEWEKMFDNIASKYVNRKNDEGYNNSWFVKEQAGNMLYYAKQEIERQNNQKLDAIDVSEEQKKELKKISQRMISAEAKEAMYDKLFWSKEDKKTFGYLEDIVNFCYRNQYVVNVQTCEKVRQLVFRLKSLCFQSRWNKDDIIRINEIIETLNIVQANRVRTQRMHYNKATIDKNIEWLKSLYQDLKRL